MMQQQQHRWHVSCDLCRNIIISHCMSIASRCALFRFIVCNRILCKLRQCAVHPIGLAPKGRYVLETSASATRFRSKSSSLEFFVPSLRSRHTHTCYTPTRCMKLSAVALWIFINLYFDSHLIGIVFGVNSRLVSLSQLSLFTRFFVVSFVLFMNLWHVRYHDIPTLKPINKYSVLK